MANHDKSYQTSFESYDCNRKQQQLIWVREDLVPRLANSIKLKEKVFRVLAVGSSKGCFDILFMKEFMKFAENSPQESFNPLKISWTVIEPSLAIQEFEKRVSEDVELVNVEFHWVNKSFEDFLQDSTLGGSEQYNLISFVSSLYYMDEDLSLRESVDKLMAPSGRVLAIVGLKDDTWDLYIEKFKSEIKSLVTGLHYTTDKTVLDIAKKYGWHHEAFEGKIEMDITTIFDRDSPDGNLLLQFFLHSDENPWATIKDETLNAFLVFLRHHSWIKTVEGEERIFIHENEGVVILSK